VDTVDEYAINIYVDGSSLPAPRRGGIGIRFVYVGVDGHEVIEDFDPLGYREGTNQEMELKACIEALRLLKRGRTGVPVDRFSKVLIHTDYMYVVENYRTALWDWQSNGWRTRDDAPVVNADLWNELIKATFGSGKVVLFTWVKGHKDSAHNKAADKLARSSAKMAYRDSLHVGTVRRKKSPQQVRSGSVNLKGQRTTIRIISDRYLPRQRCWQYKYEVVSRKSVDFQRVDNAFSDQLLKAGHTYRIRLNDNNKNPQIVKVFEEVARSPSKEETANT
jgi:ribonuclease HI